MFTFTCGLEHEVAVHWSAYCQEPAKYDLINGDAL